MTHLAATDSVYGKRQGRTCFAGTRITVDILFDYLADGFTINDFLKQFPYVERDQVTTTVKRAGAVMVARGRERKQYVRNQRKRHRIERETGKVLLDDDPLEPLATEASPSLAKRIRRRRCALGRGGSTRSPLGRLTAAKPRKS